MPLNRIRVINEHTQLGIWKVEEEAEWLLEKLQLNKEEKTFLEDIRNTKRYLHWLASRMLLRTMLNTNKFIELGADQEGKPLLLNHPYKLSISHSGDFAAVIISRHAELGIDMELISSKIEQIAHKFITRQELALLEKKFRLEQLYVYWCAKEALYKLYGKRKLDFKEHIFLKPFQYAHQGELTGSIKKGDYEKTFKVNYEHIEGYMLVYVVD